MMKKLKKFGWIACFASLAVVLVFAPVITFGLAWFGGWLLKIFVGDAVARGLNLIFNTDRFTPNIIPMACATLGTIGSYFRSSLTQHNRGDS